ncbi:hypothetical protein ACFLSJ_01800 [Verrucomicrobiota bacterium]
MPERGRIYLFDAVTLSNFALAERLDLLVSRYGRRVRVTPEVLDEVTHGVVAGYVALSAIEEALADGFLRHARPLSSSDKRETYRRLLRVLAPGQASCIACAEASGGVVVTDDRTARECCAQRGVKFTGTIGILKACCLDGTLSPDEADTVLRAMIDAGYYSPVRRISDLV